MQYLKKSNEVLFLPIQQSRRLIGFLGECIKHKFLTVVTSTTAVISIALKSLVKFPTFDDFLDIFIYKLLVFEDYVSNPRTIKRINGKTEEI